MRAFKQLADANGFRHSHRPLERDEPIPALPSLLDQIVQLSHAAQIADAASEADNDEWSQDCVVMDDEDDEGDSPIA